ncbi:metallophosphoesterase family protein [Cryptosporangium aurantiacum]|uniref:3',5'-cyclic AMP phosphodiesterase CpdA n=1 Tax=Cryptosporangium aurantiacum TaxID=134849 RepID=A0A1M7Q3Q1_9ACTN|nr:metallophosphoesterase [Cryptosporangium aurantiacum]SHN24904.1 3',5'-cyclic AMP phosphodiesterase CpdA [Cryptosporangium aurantiacum]
MTAPDTGAASLVIAHVSDLHVGRRPPTLADAVVADVHRARPDLTVVTGDCTMRARSAQLRLARVLLDQLPQPCLVIPGNHDVPLAPSRVRTPYGRYRAYVDPDIEPVLNVPGARVLGLASMPWWRWKSGRITADQAARIDAVLGGAPDGTLRVLALHHPPLATGTARLVGRALLVEALVAARVDVVMAGHTHVPASRVVELVHGGRRHRVIEVIAGTATSGRTRGAEQSWSVLRVDTGGVTVDERRWIRDEWRPGPSARHLRTPSGAP